MSEIIKIEDLLDIGECFSSNGEDWGDYLENVLDDIFDFNGGNIKIGDKYNLYIGNSATPSIKEFTPNFLDCISEQAYDEYGEFSESWLNSFSGKDTDQISRKIDNFIEALFKEKGLEPNFYKVVEIKKVNLIVSSVNSQGWDDIEFKKCNLGENE